VARNEQATGFQREQDKEADELAKPIEFEEAPFRQKYLLTTNLV
jgi:hypothetical protein